MNRLAEHDVVCISLAREHGIMTAAQAPGADDAVRLKRRKGRAQGRNSSKMRAVSASPHRDFRAAIDEKRNVAALDYRRKAFNTIDYRALVSVGEAQQDRGDVACGQGRL